MPRHSATAAGLDSSLNMKTMMICPWLTHVVLANVLAAAGVASQPSEKVARFAFGPPTSVTRGGFTKVPVKDTFALEKGFGFDSTAGLLAFDRGGSEITPPKDEHTASVYGAYRTTSDLTCALVEGTNDNAFVVALPEGDYTVWLVGSDAECDPPLFEVWANGQKKLDVRIPRRAFVFMESFRARASGGQLRLELKGPHGWILSGLVIGKEGRALAEALAAPDRDIFFLTGPGLPKWKEVKHTPANPALEWRKEESGQGYVAFPVDYMEQIVPGCVPARAMVGKPLTALATPDEFEPATFCLLARRELGNVTVELADLVGEKGQGRIAREHVSIGTVRCWLQRVSGWGGNGDYQVVPEMIEPPAGRACRVQAGQVRQWWLTVHVPPDLERLKGLGSGTPVVVCFESTCRNWEYQFVEPGKKHVPSTFSPNARRFWRVFSHKTTTHPLLSIISPEWLIRWNGYPSTVGLAPLEGTTVARAEKML
jgi:hypothetical protein